MNLLRPNIKAISLGGIMFALGAVTPFCGIVGGLALLAVVSYGVHSALFQYWMLATLIILPPLLFLVGVISSVAGLLRDHKRLGTRTTLLLNLVGFALSGVFITWQLHI